MYLFIYIYIYIYVFVYMHLHIYAYYSIISIKNSCLPDRQTGRSTLPMDKFQSIKSLPLQLAYYCYIVTHIIIVHCYILVLCIVICYVVMQLLGIVILLCGLLLLCVIVRPPAKYHNSN